MTTAPKPPAGGLPRRRFLAFAGAGLLATGTLAQGCKKDDDDDDDVPTPGPTGNSLTLTNDDVGILNYAYALEQLEADFYARVVAANNFSTNFAMGEAQLLRDIAAHELAHKEFFRRAIPADKLLRNLTPKYGTLDFTNRMQVLATARTFEDLGVSAYNGAGPLIASADYLVLAGKIVSVEARHAAFIRELSGVRFADSDVLNVDYSRMPSRFRSPIPNANGSDNPSTAAELGFNPATNNAIEKSRRPSEVLAMAAPFITETLTSQLP